LRPASGDRRRGGAPQAGNNGGQHRLAHGRAAAVPVLVGGGDLAVARPAYVTGVGMTRFAKQPDRTLKDLVCDAVIGALKDGNVTGREVEACYFANAVAGTITGQEMLAGQFTLATLGFGDIPIANVENACASASTAFHLGWQAVTTGLADVVVAVGA